MKHLKKLIPLLALGILLSACAKDKDTRPQGAEYLVSEVWTGDLLQSSWTYDQQNRLSSLRMYDGKSVVATTNYSYNEQGLLTEAASEYSFGETWVEQFEYDGEGRLVRGTTDVNGVRHLNHTYAFENDKATQVSTSSDGVEVVLTQMFDKRGNRIEITSRAGSTWVTSVYDDFDDKKHFGHASDWVKSTHNPRYEKTTTSTGQVQEFIYRYTYNEAGYVTSTEKIDKATNAKVENLSFKLIRK